MKPSGRTPLAFARLAQGFEERHAFGLGYRVSDSGELADVDGLCTYAMDRNPEIEIFRNIGGRELKFFSRIDYGGGAALLEQRPRRQSRRGVTA